MSLELTKEFPLRTGDFDRYGRLQPFSVLDILQEVATLQAEEMGIGFDAMAAKGVFWAIVRMKYEVLQQPSQHSVVRVRTWPHSLSRFSFLRDFQIADTQGNILVKATSEWVLMDAVKRSFASVLDVYDGPTTFVKERAFETKPKKIKDFDESNLEPYCIVPAYTDVDLNGHVNNARYANYIIDALNPGEEGELKTFQIDFRHEVLPGEPLKVYTYLVDNVLFAKGINDDKTTMFAAKLEG